MEGLAATLRLYRLVCTRAVKLSAANWPVLGSTFAYAVIMRLTEPIALRLGLAGGFLLGLVWAACIGSFLYLVEMIVRTSRVSLADFRRSFTMYLWNVVGIMFVFWLFWRIAMPALAQLQQGDLVVRFIGIVFFVLFNAVPELIYVGYSSALDLLRESYAFISENWIEWFPPNVLALLVLLSIAAIPAQGAGAMLLMAGVSLFLYFTMVMRGLLFQELSQFSRRGRVFRYRTGQ